MKTDLAKILSVSGSRGLYRYLAQARNGVIAEALSDGKRTVFGGSSRISTLADIAIYTSEGELKLSEVFLALKSVLGDSDAPSSKSPSSELEALFAKAIPNSPCYLAYRYSATVSVAPGPDSPSTARL